VTLKKREKDRLDMCLKTTGGTMEIALLVETKDELKRFTKAKAGRKWAKLVEVRYES
jgi:hypothetical protein